MEYLRCLGFKDTFEGAWNWCTSHGTIVFFNVVFNFTDLSIRSTANYDYLYPTANAH